MAGRVGIYPRPGGEPETTITVGSVDAQVRVHNVHAAGESWQFNVMQNRHHAAGVGDPILAQRPLLPLATAFVEPQLVEVESSPNPRL